MNKDSQQSSTGENSQSLLSEDQSAKKPFFQRAFSPIRQGAIRGAIFALLASAMGTGIFNLPFRISQLGIIGFGVFIATCGYFSYTGMRILSRLMLQFKVHSYSEMASVCSGQKMQRLSAFCLVIYPWGITICFQVIFAQFFVQSLADLFGMDLFQNRSTGEYNDSGNLCRIIVNVCLLLANMPFILKKDITLLQKMSIICVCSVIINAIIILITSFSGFTDQTTKLEYLGLFTMDWTHLRWLRLTCWDEFSELLQGFASILFCYVSHQMVFPIGTSLVRPQPRRFQKIFVRVHFIEVLIYTIVGIFAYLLLCQHPSVDIKSIVMASITTLPMKLGKVLMLCSLFIAIPLNFYPARAVFLETLKIEDTRRNYLIVSIGGAILSCLIAIVFQKVNSYFGLLGGTAGVLIAGGIPAACSLKLELALKDKAVLVFCTLVSIMGMMGAVLSVVDPL